MAGGRLTLTGLLPGGPAFWTCTVTFAWFFGGGITSRRSAISWFALCFAAAARVLLFLRRTYSSVTLWRRAVSLYKAGDYAEAEPLFARAADLCPTAFGTCRVYAAVLNDWAAACERMGQHEKAEPLYLEALDVLREVIGEHHRDYAFSLRNLAAMYESIGRFEQAEPLHLEAVGVWKSLHGDSHPSYAAALSSLAECMRAKSFGGRSQTAEGLQRAAARRDSAWRALARGASEELLAREVPTGADDTPGALPATAESEAAAGADATSATEEVALAEGAADAAVGEGLSPATAESEVADGAQSHGNSVEGSIATAQSDDLDPAIAAERIEPVPSQGPAAAPADGADTEAEARGASGDDGTLLDAAAADALISEETAPHASLDASSSPAHTVTGRVHTEDSAAPLSPAAADAEAHGARGVHAASSQCAAEESAEGGGDLAPPLPVLGQAGGSGRAECSGGADSLGHLASRGPLDALS